MIQLKKWTRIKRQINQSTELKVGLFFLLILVLIAIFADVIATHDPTFLNDDLLAPPSRTYLFGTDALGRDLFSMVILGTRTSLSIGLIAALISNLLGIIIGAIAGYYGGWFDRLIAEVINVFMMVPTFFLIIIVVALYGSNILNIILVIALTSWTGAARMMRSQVIALKERTFIKSLITLGESDWRIITRHIVPNGIYPIITSAASSVSGAILYESALSFLGLGDPLQPSWGRIVYNGKSYLTRAWWVALFGGLFLVITVYAFHLIAEGFNQISNPLRQEEL